MPLPLPWRCRCAHRPAAAPCRAAQQQCREVEAGAEAQWRVAEAALAQALADAAADAAAEEDRLREQNKVRRGAVWEGAARRHRCDAPSIGEILI